MARTSGTSSDSADNTDTSRPAVKEGGIRVSDILAGGLRWWAAPWARSAAW